MVDDLGDAETVEGGWVVTEGLDLALHAGPGRREDLVSALLETRLPALQLRGVSQRPWMRTMGVFMLGLLTWFSTRTVRRVVWELMPVQIALDENRVSKWSSAPLTVRGFEFRC